LAGGLVLYVPFVFVAPMAEQGGVTPIRAAAFISVIGFASTAARVVFGLVAGRVGDYGMDSLGTVTGVIFTSASVGALLGAPLAGLLVDTSGGYLLPTVVMLAIATLATIGPLFLPGTHRSRPPQQPAATPRTPTHRSQSAPSTHRPDTPHQ
jgi:hypothetical protein